MRKLSLAMVVFVLGGLGFCQSPVTVTGTIFDDTNILATSGTVTFQISPASPSIMYFIPNVGIVASITAKCGINGSGVIQNLALSGPCLVWGNDVISPANTSYTVTLAPNGVVTQTISNIQIAGASASLNSPIFVPNVQLVPQVASIVTPAINGNLIPTVDSVFTLGGPSNRYSNVYANAITFTTFIANLIQTTTIQGQSGGSVTLNPTAGVIVNSVSFSDQPPTNTVSAARAVTSFNLLKSTTNRLDHIDIVPSYAASSGFPPNNADCAGPGTSFAWDSTNNSLDMSNNCDGYSKVARTLQGTALSQSWGGTQNFSSATVTFGSGGTTFLSNTFTPPPAQTLTQKTGTGAGNYSKSSACGTYEDVDGTNLALTQTIPIGFKASITTMVTFVMSASTAQFALTDGTTVLVQHLSVGSAATTATDILRWTFTGDGASHTWKLRDCANGGATITIQNSSATNVPTLDSIVLPSN